MKFTHKRNDEAAHLESLHSIRDIAVRSSTSPLATLDRGYAIVTLTADGSILSHAERAPPGSEIDARLAHGSVRARVQSRRN